MFLLLGVLYCAINNCYPNFCMSRGHEMGASLPSGIRDRNKKPDGSFNSSSLCTKLTKSYGVIL